jgi:hypothetical protein
MECFYSVELAEDYIHPKLLKYLTEVIDEIDSIGECSLIKQISLLLALKMTEVALPSYAKLPKEIQTGFYNIMLHKHLLCTSKINSNHQSSSFFLICRAQKEIIKELEYLFGQ